MDNVGWTIDGTGSGSSFPYFGNVDSNKGLQFGSGNSPFTYLSLSTTGISGTIQSITVNASTASSANATLSVTVGGTSYINSSLTNSSADYTGTGTSSGEIVISITQTTSKALYIKSISITYQPGSTTQTCVAPTFDPDGGVFTGSAEVTITSNTDGATIYYTTDGTDPVVSRSSIANGGTVTLTESCTLKAMAVKSGYDNSPIVTSQSYTITSGGSNSKIYRKVSSTVDLTAGQKYIIMYENGTSSVGMGEYDGTKHFNGVPNLIISNNKVNIANTSVLELTLGGTAGAWTLYTGSGYIQGNASVQFNIVNNASAANSKWVITNSDTGTNGFVVRNDDNARYIKFFNSTSGPSFRNYNSSDGDWAYLYVQDNSTDPVVTISPDEQTISDSTSPATLTITGTNVSGSISASLATNTDWYLNPNTFSNTGGTASLTYNGRALSASNVVTATASGAENATATVNYVSDIYIVTDNGVTGDWHFDGQYGVQMTNNNGVYTADFTVTTPNTFILFARKTGNDVTWNTRYVFGPNSGGDWWLDVSGNGDGTLDLYDDDPIKIQTTGIFTVTINANDGTFTITKRNIEVTITPADGTHFTGPSISGTITSDPAGTIEWSTDGTNWQSYSDGFTATVSQPGQSVTVYARSTVNGIVSDVASATYTRDYAPAPEPPVFSRPGGEVSAGTVVTITAPEGYTLYVDGQQVNNPYQVTINSATTISAYCVNDEGTQSETVSYTFTISAVCEAEIVFKDNGSDSSTAVSNNSIQDYYLEGDDFISSVSAIDKVYKGTAGLKFGSSSAGGSITFNLDTEFIDSWKVTHVILNAKQYNTSNVTLTVTTSSGESKTTSALTSSLANYSLDFDDSEITSITISSSSRAYLKGFTIVYDCVPQLAAPVITPASGAYYESQTVSISAEDGATIYYTLNGGETQTYTEPFTVPLDDDHFEATVVAWAEKDGEVSREVTATYTLKKDEVYSIAEFLKLGEGNEVTFMNPVVVLFDYSQNSSGGQEYIWVKDRTGYTQFFIAPQFDAASIEDPQYNGTYGQFVPKYENGDVIPAGFKVKKGYYETGEYYQGQCYDTHSSFQKANDKALADPEQVTLSELLANPADYNNRYLFINKMQVNYSGTGLNFSIATDENDDNIAEVEGGTVVVGYNKYNSPAWKNKDGETIGVDIPEDDRFYNVTFIFQKWQYGYEIMPIKFTPWVETSLRLEDLVEIGEENETYTISNPLIAAAVTWDDNQGKFAIFAKDDEMFANKSYPGADMKSYRIDFINSDTTFTNEVYQEDYDQSNWIEILIPNDGEITNKTSNPDGYYAQLDELKAQYENKILPGGSIHGQYIDVFNPTIDMATAPVVETSSTYDPNIYCTGNFLMENLDADGATSYRGDEYGGQFFMMDAKPQEFCMVVWAYFIGNDNYFVAPAREGDKINGYQFHGSFLADMSLCREAYVVKDSPVSAGFRPSNNSTPETLYGFNAIVRKNPASSYWSTAPNGAPHRIQPYSDGKESVPAYIVYPLNAQESSNGNVTDVEELASSKTMESVRYFNVMGMESKTPFEGINIVVTRYTDGSFSTVKVLK